MAVVVKKLAGHVGDVVQIGDRRYDVVSDKAGGVALEPAITETADHVRANPLGRALGIPVVEGSSAVAERCGVATAAATGQHSRALRTTSHSGVDRRGSRWVAVYRQGGRQRKEFSTTFREARGRLLNRVPRHRLISSAGGR